MIELSLSRNRRVQLLNLATVLSVVLSVILRFWSIDLQGSFVFDELVLIEGSSSLQHLLQTMRFENIPPLYWLFSFLWLKIFPVTEFNVRLLSVIFAIATIPAAYFLARKVLSDNSFTAASVIMVSLSPFLVFYAGFARPYALLSLLSIWFVYESLQISTRKLPYRFILSGWLLSLTHLFGIMTVFMVNLVLILQSSKKLRKKQVWISFITHFPVLLWFLVQLSYRITSGSSPTWYEVGTSYPTLFLLSFLLPFTTLESNPTTIILLLLIIVLAYQLPSIAKKNPELFLFLIATISGPLTASALGLEVVRYLSGAIPLIIILSLILIRRLHSPLLKAAIIGFFVLNMILSLTSFARILRPCYDQAIQSLPQDEVVFVAPPARAIIYKHYVSNPSLMHGLEGLYPAQTYVDRIKYNYRQQYTPAAAENIIDQLNPYPSFILASTKESFPQEESILPAIHQLGFQTISENYYQCARPITIRYFRRS